MWDDAYYKKRRKTIAEILVKLAEMKYDFRQFDREHREMYLKYQPQTELSSRSLLSQYTYAEEDCICCWEDQEAQCLYIICLSPENELLACPPMLREYTPERFALAVEKYRQIFAAVGMPLQFENVAPEETEWFADLPCETTIAAPLGEMDYIYEFESLRDFEGSKNSNRRRKRSYFLRRHQVTAEPVGADNLAECENVLKKWCVLRTCDACGHRCPKDTGLRALAGLDAMNGMGYLIRVDGIAQTVALMGRMSPEMLDVLTFCSISRETGADETAYALIADEVLPEYKYMNLEEDMEIERLRKHKQSMHPCRMQPKHIVLFPQDQQGVVKS